MAEAIYVLCALASVFCAGLLLKNYRRNRNRLTLWTSLCFVGLAINNLFLLVDLILVPEVDFSLWRTLIALTAIGTLLFGLIWEER
jgi:hypothetical protein